ncbi:MAG: Gfo/Idh/MocA family oxidoreductase [Clostridia bacterium]|nr:Gfo/Idh/MocA family oxidoreductase [Clostridia bacterium]
MLRWKTGPIPSQTENMDYNDPDELVSPRMHGGVIDMWRTAILGVGFIGTNHAEALLNSKMAELTAIVELNEEAGKSAAAKYGCPYYATLEEALSKEPLDVVIICLPSYLHEEHAVRAVGHKLHVLCEKPFSLSVESARRMFDAAERNGVGMMAAQAARWTPELVEINDMIKKDMIGKIHIGVAKRLGQHPNWSTWHRDPAKSGGGLYDLCIHDLDFLVSVFGKVRSVHSIGWRSPTKCWNHIVNHLIFTSGANISCEASMEMPDGYPFSVGYRIVGDKGGVEYNYAAGFNIHAESTSSLICYENGGERKVLEVVPKDVYQLEIEAFLSCLHGEQPLPVTREDTLEVLSIAEAINQSLETGKPVEL